MRLIPTIDVANNRHAIVTTITYVRGAYGDLGVRYRAQGAAQTEMVGVFATHRARRDTFGLAGSNGAQRCDGLTVTWDDELETTTIRLPARCFLRGDYDRIKIKAITERGSDADLAVESGGGRWRFSRWVARG